LVGPSTAVTECGGEWATAHVQATCQVLQPNGPVHVLGVDIGDMEVRRSQFREAIEAVAAVHAAVGGIGDAATELVLTRRCADVCKVTHLLRAYGA